MIEEQKIREDVEQELVDIDHKILNYIKTNIAFDISDNNNRVPITVKTTKPQRWSSVLNREEERDTTETKGNLPLITLSRFGIDNSVDVIPNWIPDELYSYVLNKVNQKRETNANNGYYTVTRKPSDVNITYEIRIVSETQKHNDIIQQRFLVHNRKAWSTDGYTFRVTYPSINDGSVAPQIDQERLIRSTFTMSLNTKIKTSVTSDETQIVKKVYPVTAVKLDVEVEMTEEETKKIFGY